MTLEWEYTHHGWKSGDYSIFIRMHDGRAQATFKGKKNPDWLVDDDAAKAYCEYHAKQVEGLKQKTLDNPETRN